MPHRSIPADRPDERFRRAAELPRHLIPAAQSASGDAGILVTGGTGFLGCHLVASLLRRTSSAIVCLVRGDAETVAGRLLERLAAFGVNPPPHRIVVRSGSITEPRFGLSETAFTDLANSVGIVFHLAARLDFRGSFEALLHVNVNPLRQILELASAGIRKRIVHVSSLSVLETTSNYNRTVRELTPLEHPELLPLGYAQTKWTAETMLAAARTRGYEVVCVRPAWIVGHDRRGIETDFVASVIRAFATIGAAPETDGVLNLVPVDFVAEACAALGLTTRADRRIFHLGSPNAVSVSQLVEGIVANGCSMERVPLPMYFARLSDELKRGRSLDLMKFRHILVGSPLRPAIGLPYLDGRAPVFDSTSSLEILGSTGISRPTLDIVSLVRNCLRLSPAS
jgi:thioester reductase-like protein